MDSIIQLLRSYLQFRSAILRVSDLDQISHQTFTQITGLVADSKYRRRLKPELWKISELNKLSIMAKLPNTVLTRLSTVALFIDNLPDKQKRLIYKACSLNQKKISLRIQEVDNWQHVELEKLTQVLERIRDY